MAFLDFLFGGGGGPIKRNGRKLADRNAQVEDREAAARALADDGSEEALLALFGRYNLQLEHGMKDQKEKDLVFQLLSETGAPAAKAARIFAKSSVNFQGAVRVVEAVEGPKAAVDLLIDLLAQERVEDEFKIDKKKNLVIMLAERKDERVAAAVTPFLADFDEGVRNGAMEALAAQEGDVGLPGVAQVLANPKEESTRILGRAAEIFATRQWKIPEEHQEWLAGHLPGGFRMNEGRIVAGR